MPNNRHMFRVSFCLQSRTGARGLLAAHERWLQDVEGVFQALKRGSEVLSKRAEMSSLDSKPTFWQSKSLIPQLYSEGACSHDTRLFTA